jgi:hypothetical protein
LHLGLFVFLVISSSNFTTNPIFHNLPISLVLTLRPLSNVVAHEDATSKTFPKAPQLELSPPL